MRYVHFLFFGRFYWLGSAGMGVGIWTILGFWTGTGVSEKRYGYLDMCAHAFNMTLFARLDRRKKEGD